MCAGPAVGAALLPCLVGGVIGAGAGCMLLYGGMLEEGGVENIFEEGAEAGHAKDAKKAKAHSPYEPTLLTRLPLARPSAKFDAASVVEPRRSFSRGFAAMFQ